MTTFELSRALRDRIPAHMACDWDNDGIMCLPDPDRAACRVLVVLDITDEAVERAIEGGYDAIVSHHPLIFKGIKHLTPDDIIARRLIKLCRHGIAALSYHTALDAMNGVNDRLAAQLGLTNIAPFGSEEFPIGRVGDLPEAMSAEAFAAHVIEALGGSGADDIPAAMAAGADTMVTGEAGYHYVLDAAAMGFDVITAGHFFTEQSTLAMLTELLTAIDPAIQTDIYNTNRMVTVVGR